MKLDYINYTITMENLKENKIKQDKTYTNEIMIAIIPPLSSWEQYIKIKSNHFKPSLANKGRCPFPHITLAQSRHIQIPVKTIVEKLSIKMVSKIPFILNLANVEMFKYKKNTVLYVDVSGDKLKLSNLYQSVCQCGFKTSSDWTPHIGIGSVLNSQALSLVSKYQQQLCPIAFTVTHLYILQRGSTGPWEVTNLVPIGKTEKTVSDIVVGSLMDYNTLSGIV